MKLSDFNQGNSPYLKSADLAGHPSVTVTIKGFTVETMRDGEDKPVMWFENKSKGLVMNKTNQDRLVNHIQSDDSDKAIGLDVELYTETTTYGPGLRIRFLGKPVSPQQQAPIVMPDGRETAPPDFDDEINF